MERDTTSLVKTVTFRNWKKIVCIKIVYLSTDHSGCYFRESQNVVKSHSKGAVLNDQKKKHTSHFPHWKVSKLLQIFKVVYLIKEFSKLDVIFGFLNIASVRPSSLRHYSVRRWGASREQLSNRQRPLCLIAALWWNSRNTHVISLDDGSPTGVHSKWMMMISNWLNV